MAKNFVCVLLVFICGYVLASPQANSDTGEDYELDYSEPGIPTEDCLCVPFYQCVDGEIVSDGSNIIDPRKKPQVEELGLVSSFSL